MADTLKFSRNHLWLRVDGTRACVGISEHAQGELREIIDLELPDVGDNILRGEAFGQLESVEGVNELIAPVTGQVVAINTELEDHPGVINEDPYHEGWLIELELNDDAELDDPELMDPDEYDDFISGEEDA
jgi:glycine cleavage system H protein